MSVNVSVMGNAREKGEDRPGAPGSTPVSKMATMTLFHAILERKQPMETKSTHPLPSQVGFFVTKSKL